ncbi:TPA: phage tail protein [Yersinia enterocolitica]
MFHLDNETGVPVMPNLPPVQSNTTKWFTEGGNGVPPSWPGSTWFNIIQSEILNVLAAADIPPDKENLSQLSEAIQYLITLGVPDLKDASLTQKGIVQLSNATNSTSEIFAATPKAVRAVDVAALKIANNLSEITTAGPVAVAATLLNLGLGDAAKLGVATDAEVIAGLVGKAITAATLKSRFASVVLYPSGTEAVPPTLTAGQRIVIDNPFPGRPVSAEVEVFANGIWDSPNIMVAPQGNGGPSAGAKAKYLFDSDKIVIQTAGNGVLYLSIYSGSAHNFLSGGDVFSGTIFSARQYRLRVRTL